MAQPCTVQIECQQIVDELVQQRSLDDQQAQRVQRECQATIDTLVRQRSEEDEHVRIIRAELAAAQARVDELESVRPPPQPQRRDASTQTGGAYAQTAETQTEQTGGKAVATQTDREESEPTKAGSATTVGPRLHPAQLDAIQRAEQAAERLERLQAETERIAERYACESPPHTPSRTGGRQVRKAQLRRQAAAAGVAATDWMMARGPQVLHGTWFKDARAVLEQRLDLAHEEWKRRQGTEDAEERFRLAARATGVTVE